MTQENEHFLNKGVDEEKDPLLERIVCDPNIMVGKPTIKGTRIPVDIVLANLSVGLDLDELFESYPSLKLDDVKACLRYAYEVLAGDIIPPALPRSTIFEEEEGWIDIPTGWMDTEEELEKFTEEKAEYIQERLRRMVKRNLSQRMKLVKDNFPEIYTDAERFINLTNYTPWEVGAFFLEEESEARIIHKKYEVNFARHKPKDLDPKSDMFCEASDLIDQKRAIQAEERWNISCELKKENKSISQEELDKTVNEKMEKRDKEWPEG